VLNRSAAPTSSEEEDALLTSLSALQLDAAAQEVLLAGRLESRLERATAEALERLKEAVSTRILSLPRLGAHGGLPAGADKIVGQMQIALERARIRERK
jgi:hypothetical protein